MTNFSLWTGGGIADNFLRPFFHFFPACAEPPDAIFLRALDWLRNDIEHAPDAWPREAENIPALGLADRTADSNTALTGTSGSMNILTGKNLSFCGVAHHLPPSIKVFPAALKPCWAPWIWLFGAPWFSREVGGLEQRQGTLPEDTAGLIDFAQFKRSN